VKADKEREATYGHDGTWVAHPAWCRSPGVFDRLMPAPNQIAASTREVNVRGARSPALGARSRSPNGPAAQHQRRHPVHRRLARGQGAVPIFNLMEDAATAEISRSQVWQWIRSQKGVLDDGRKVTKAWSRR
jgi:malate synthase